MTGLAHSVAAMAITGGRGMDRAVPVIIRFPGNESSTGIRKSGTPAFRAIHRDAKPLPTPF